MSVEPFRTNHPYLQTPS